MSIDLPSLLDRIYYRYPSFLIDTVAEHEPGSRLVAIKNVTVNEEFFQGHFPGSPLMPGYGWILGLALFVTMLLCGLWHGAAWNFVLWGAYHGALIIGQRVLRPRSPAAARLLVPVGTLLLFPLMAFSFLIFRAESLAGLGELCAGLLRWQGAEIAIWPFVFGMAFVALEQIISELGRRRDFEWGRHPYFAHGLAGAGLVVAVLLRPATYAPFIYFQF